MSLYADILKIRQIPQTDENPLFVSREDSTTVKKNRKLKVKPPRNVNLYECDDINSSKEYNEIPQDQYLHENEIASSIKEANCGINYSNDQFEEQWKARQAEARLNSGDAIFSKNLISDIKTCNEIPILKDNTDKTDSIKDEENILKKCRLNKNAVIRGLLRNNLISLADLHVPNDCTHVKDTDSTNTQNENVSSTSENNFVKLVQCPEDPEVLIQPLQVYGHIDESKYKDIDFTIPHIGKKEISTARRFFINADDSDFVFIKKDKNQK